MTGRARLAARRKALGLTQESLAELLRVERSTVARWEQGSASPRPWYRRGLADALELSLDELDALLDVQAEHADSFSWSVDADRERPHADQAEAIRGDARRLIDLDTKYGGDDLVLLATRAVRTADQQLANGRLLSGQVHDLHAAIGELAQVGGWIAYDAEHQTLARQLTTEALLHSRLAGDRHQELFELAQLALQSIHVGRPTDALQIANQVIENEDPSPRVAAVFHLRRARALALMDDRTRALDEHDRAAAVLLGGTSSRNDPAWTWWVDASELAWHRAMSLTALDDSHAAVDLFRLGYETRPLSARRARYNDLAHLVEAEVGARAWSDAEPDLEHVLIDAPDIRSARTAIVLRRASLAVCRAGPPAPSAASDLSRLVLAGLQEPRAPLPASEAR
jgi:transcriptional regulator with XRE-family HTH domain